MDKTLGQYILERRKALGLTQEQIADRMGHNVRQSEISRLERNHVMLPRRQRLELLAAALETTIADLLGKTEWISHGQELPDDLIAALEEVPLKDAEGIALDTLATLATLVIAVTELRKTVELVDRKLDEVDQTISSAVSGINSDRDIRNALRPDTGIIDTRESSGPFLT